MNILPPSSPLLRKLERLISPTDEERQAVRQLPVQLANIVPGQDIVRQGDRPLRSCFIEEGITCAYKTTGSGKRQIAAFHIAGDAPDLQSLHLKVLDMSISSLTACTVAFVRHEHLRELCRLQPRVADALWHETLVDGSIYREWLTSVGQRSAFARIAHLMCEMIVKHNAVGLCFYVDGKPSIDWAVTQTQLGDALGLSTVHVNGSLQRLRSEDLIYLKGGRLTALNWKGLQEAGDFDQEYLHLHDDLFNGGAITSTG